MRVVLVVKVRVFIATTRKGVLNFNESIRVLITILLKTPLIRLIKLIKLIKLISLIRGLGVF